MSFDYCFGVRRAVSIPTSEFEKAHVVFYKAIIKTLHLPNTRITVGKFVPIAGFVFDMLVCSRF